MTLLSSPPWNSTSSPGMLANLAKRYSPASRFPSVPKTRVEKFCRSYVVFQSSVSLISVSIVAMAGLYSRSSPDMPVEPAGAATRRTPMPASSKAQSSTLRMQACRRGHLSRAESRLMNDHPEDAA